MGHRATGIAKLMSNVTDMIHLLRESAEKLPPGHAQRMWGMVITSVERNQKIYLPRGAIAVLIGDLELATQFPLFECKAPPNHPHPSAWSENYSEVSTPKKSKKVTQKSTTKKTSKKQSTNEDTVKPNEKKSTAKKARR